MSRNTPAMKAQRSRTSEQALEAILQAGIENSDAVDTLLKYCNQLTTKHCLQLFAQLKQADTYYKKPMIYILQFRVMVKYEEKKVAINPIPTLRKILTRIKPLISHPTDGLSPEFMAETRRHIKCPKIFQPNLYYQAECEWLKKGYHDQQLPGPDTLAMLADMSQRLQQTTPADGIPHATLWQSPSQPRQNHPAGGGASQSTNTNHQSDSAEAGEGPRAQNSDPDDQEDPKSQHRP